MIRLLLSLLSVLLIAAAFFLLADTFVFALRSANQATGAIRGCYVLFDDWFAEKQPKLRNVQTATGLILFVGAVFVGWRSLRAARPAVQLVVRADFGPPIC